jgi:hypothetical protein
MHAAVSHASAIPEELPHPLLQPAAFRSSRRRRLGVPARARASRRTRSTRTRTSLAGPAAAGRCTTTPSPQCRSTKTRAWRSCAGRTTRRASRTAPPRPHLRPRLPALVCLPRPRPLVALARHRRPRLARRARRRLIRSVHLHRRPLAAALARPQVRVEGVHGSRDAAEQPTPATAAAGCAAARSRQPGV